MCVYFDSAERSCASLRITRTCAARSRRANKSPSSFPKIYIQQRRRRQQQQKVKLLSQKWFCGREKHITSPLITMRYRWLSQIDRPDDALDDHRPKIFDLRQAAREQHLSPQTSRPLSNGCAYANGFLALSRSPARCRSLFCRSFLKHRKLPLRDEDCTECIFPALWALIWAHSPIGMTKRFLKASINHEKNK